MSTVFDTSNFNLVSEDNLNEDNWYFIVVNYRLVFVGRFDGTFNGSMHFFVDDRDEEEMKMAGVPTNMIGAGFYVPKPPPRRRNLRSDKAS